MNGLRQVWLVALREMRERSRSRAFRASLAIMILLVIGVIALPNLLDDDGARKVGVTGDAPTELVQAIRDQAEAAGITVRLTNYVDRTDGDQAVRDDDIDVLVAGGEQLVWRREGDDQLAAVATAAIQQVAVQRRVAESGLGEDELTALLAPVPVEHVEIGSVAGRTPDDEAAAMIMMVLLFIAISTYGNLVLTGVVEEKASRVVEVLLARLPARNLLAGKVVGIGLLGFAQFCVTAAVAFVTLQALDSVDIPAARGAVLAWVVVWFVLGYALYAMAYGAVGSLASRTEDAQSVAGPIMGVLIAGYFASFVTLGRPESGLAVLLSFFPATAPLSMTNRIAMGAVAWWEPLLSVGVTVATIGALVQLGGRVYANAVLRTGPTQRLRDVWRDTAPSNAAGTRQAPPGEATPVS